MAGKVRRNVDERLIAVLAGGASMQAAAQLCEVSERTVRRRMKDEVFRRRLQQARTELVERAIGHLSRGSTEAAVTLRKLLRGKVSDTVKLGAAKSILELGNRLRESTEIEERLQALEERLAQQERKK